MAPFLEAFRGNANVLEACKAAQVTRNMIYRRLKDDVAFAAEFASAKSDAVDTLADVAWARAKDHSDTLLIYLLKVHGGPEYRNDQRRQQEHSLSEQSMRAMAQRIAEIYGVDADEIMRAAEEVAREAWETVPR